MYWYRVGQWFRDGFARSRHVLRPVNARNCCSKKLDALFSFVLTWVRDSETPTVFYYVLYRSYKTPDKVPLVDRVSNVVQDDSRGDIVSLLGINFNNYFVFHVRAPNQNWEWRLDPSEYIWSVFGFLEHVSDSGQNWKGQQSGWIFSISVFRTFSELSLLVRVEDFARAQRKSY